MPGGPRLSSFVRVVLPHTQRSLYIEQYPAKWCLLKCMLDSQFHDLNTNFIVYGN